MADDMWKKYVKKRFKTNKIWSKITENTIRKIVKKPVVDFNSTNNEEFAKKKEKTIFGPRHPTLYIGIVIIFNRVAFIVMQDNGNTDHEQNLTDAKSNIWTRNKENQGGQSIQKVLVYYGGILSVINPDAARLKKVFLSNHNSAPEGFPRNGCWKGDSVCRNMMGIVPQ